MGTTGGLTRAFRQSTSGIFGFCTGTTGRLCKALSQATPRIFGFHVGTREGFIICRPNPYNIIKDFPLVRFDGRQHIRLIDVLPDLDLDSSPVECFRILVVRRLTVYFVCCLDDLVQIGCHPHLVCISFSIFPLKRFGRFRPDKFISPVFMVQNRPAVPLKAVRETLLDGLLDSGLPLFLWNIFQNIFVDFDIRLSGLILQNRKPNPLLSRRALGLEGCGVFFCRPQVVHGLFCVGEILVL